VDLERLRRGVAELEALGFQARAPEAILARTRFTAGSAARRAAELTALFEDPAVAGIFCARGGAGAAQILGLLQPESIARNPKVFVGFSDVTFLHLFLARQRLVSFHGPMVARDMADGSYDRDSLLRGVTGEGEPYASGEDDLLPLRGGAAEGTLRGGCLSILAAAAGTPWALQPDPEGTLLFLEDADEAPYRIDRMLWQLRRSGALEGVRGIVFGDMKGCAPALRADWTLEDVLLDALAGLDVPVAIGLSSGHSAAPNVTLPLGVRARLECGDSARFAVLEPAVA
jgi:muramoyltetrapeptide carboxypeptidase